MCSNNVTRADNQQERPEEVRPWYICGFVEGEGTFHVALYKDPRMRFGIKVIPEFRVSQSHLRIEPLVAMQRHFDCGQIRSNHSKNMRDDTNVFVVRNRNDLQNIIIPFFQRYPLLSNKAKVFNVFSKIVMMMGNGEHSTKTGLRKIIDLSYQMNGAGKYRKVDKQSYLSLLESSETIRRTSTLVE